MLSFRRLLIQGVLIASVVAGASVLPAATPGTRYPAQKLVFTDPLTGRTVWRMTTDGAQTGALHLAAGDQSSESRSFSPDSTRIVYAKSGAGASKPDGIYVMDIQTGIETYLAPAPYYASPVFARDGSGEVYYYERVSGTLVVRAVDVVTYRVRTVVTLPEALWQEKIEVNADGSYIAVHPQLGDGSYRTVIFTPQGAIHPNWTLDGPASEDGALWHPTDPNRILTGRAIEGRMWHVDTLTKTPGDVDLWPGHASLHPNGAWLYSPSYLTDIATGASVLPGTGLVPIHPDINPAEGGLGAGARVIADDREWFDDDTGRPRLYVLNLARLIEAALSGDWRVPDAALAVHYSSMANNVAHVHAHWSWDGKYILWTSDVADLQDGAPPGGTGGGTDLFIVPMEIDGVSLDAATVTVAPGNLTVSAEGGLAITPGGPASPLPVSTQPEQGSSQAPQPQLEAGVSAVAPMPVRAVAPAELVTAPSEIYMTAPTGTSAPSEFLRVEAIGGRLVKWSAVSDSAWLAVTPSSGTTPSGVIVSASTDGLSIGTYAGTISVTHKGAGESSKTVVVTLTVRSDLTLLAIVPDWYSPQPSGATIVFTATALGTPAPHQYKWLVFDGLAWRVVQEWSASPTFAWSPSVASDDYRIGVWVRSAENSADIYDRVESAGSIPFPILP